MDLSYEVAVTIAYFLTMAIPTAFVVRCLLKTNTIEGTLCFRIVQDSENHPVLLPALESLPTFVLFAVLYPINELQFSSMVIPYLAFTIVRLIYAWRRGKYPW